MLQYGYKFAGCKLRMNQTIAPVQARFGRILELTLIFIAFIVLCIIMLIVFFVTFGVIIYKI